MEHDRKWPSRISAGVGKRVAYFRERTTDDRGRKLTVQGLADRCEQLGLPLGRPTIAKLENGLRDTITVGEVQVLARALGVAPVLLLFPLGVAETVEMLPGTHADTLDALLWFTDSADTTGDVGLFTTHRDLVDAWPPGQEGPVPTGLMTGSMTAEEKRRWRQSVGIQQQLRQVRAFIRERGLTPPRLDPALAWIDDGGTSPGAQPVVAAIVTSAGGVLVGRRNDGSPPWTFIAGEVEPGERPEDAAVREVKEETGLEVQVGHEIGRRVHPETSRTMIYLAARPVRGTKVIVGDEVELAEVRWVSLAEADDLLPGMFRPVRAHLARTLARKRTTGGSDGSR